MFVTINTIFGPQWHNTTMFLNSYPTPVGVSYPQLEWNYPPIRKDFGIGLDLSSINYFSTNDVLARDFVIFGAYDPSSPMLIPFCSSSSDSSSSYFLSQPELEKLLSCCQNSVTRRMKDSPKILYLVTNRQVVIAIY